MARVPPQPAPPPPAAGRALIVDDERSLVQSLCRMLSKDVGTVETYEDPREALAAIMRGERFDVVFTDIRMPLMTGIEFYEAVRQIDVEQSDRFVFISGDITRPDVQQFLAGVTNERVEKPFSVQRIRGIARRLIANRATPT